MRIYKNNNKIGLYGLCTKNKHAMFVCHPLVLYTISSDLNDSLSMAESFSSS